MVNFSTILRGAKKVVPELIGSKNGISVYREFLKDGTTITKSYKGGQLYKTITQSQGDYTSWFHHYKQFTTDVFNHTTGKTFQVNRSISANGEKIWQAGNIGLPNQQRILKFNYHNKIFEDTIRKTQANNGTLSVTRRPGVSSRPTLVTANNYEMPNGKIVNGEWGSSRCPNMFGIKRLPYSVKIGDKFYSGNSEFEWLNRQYAFKKPIGS